MTIKEGQHLHNALANEIGTCKRRMFDRLKSGAKLEDAIALFMAELQLALDCVIRKVTNVSTEPVPH